MVTLNEIAKLAGVSKSTVSRYLNNGSVSEKTRKKIDKIVQETGYTPNVFAQSLKAERTNIIGVIIPRFDSKTTNLVLNGLDQLAYKDNFQLIILNSNLSLERQKDNITTLQKQKVAGIVLVASYFDPEHIEQIQQSSVPIVVVGQQISGVPSIIYDDYGAGKSLATLGIEQGHTTFLFVGVTPNDKAVGVERRNGFEKTLTEHQLATDFILTEFNYQATYQLAKAFLVRTSATMIVGATDTIALAIYQAAREMNLTIPGDFSLAGFGGYYQDLLVHDFLTSVKFDYFNTGQKAMTLIQQMILKEPVPEVTVQPFELIQAQSTKEM